MITAIKLQSQNHLANNESLPILLLKVNDENELPYIKFELGYNDPVYLTFREAKELAESLIALVMTSKPLDN